MTTLFEKPFLIGVLGAISAVVLGFLWLQTQRRLALYGLFAVLVLTVIGIVLASSIVTDREAVEAVLYQAAQAVEDNDLTAVLALIHSQSTSIRDQATAEFPQHEFHQLSIKPNLEITFDRPEQPTEATAKFNVVVSGSERNGLVKNWRVPRFCIVTFRKDGDAWRVFAYQHDDAMEGLLDRPKK
jgi:flagellar motor component MotA